MLIVIIVKICYLRKLKNSTECKKTEFVGATNSKQPKLIILFFAVVIITVILKYLFFALERVILKHSFCNNKKMTLPAVERGSGEGRRGPIFYFSKTTTFH